MKDRINEIKSLVDDRFSYLIANELINYTYSEGIEYLRETLEDLWNTASNVRNENLNSQEESRIYKVMDFLDLFKEEANYYELVIVLPGVYEIIEKVYKTRMLAEKDYERVLANESYFSVSLCKNDRLIKNHFND